MAGNQRSGARAPQKTVGRSVGWSGRRTRLTSEGALRGDGVGEQNVSRQGEGGFLTEIKKTSLARNQLDSSSE